MNNNCDIKCDDWFGCYAKNGWLGGVLLEASFAHPAKVSFLLAERTYQHAKEEGWLKEGQLVVDPFAGIGGFAFHALQHGLNWVGVELESKFVDLAEQNIALWNCKYDQMPQWGTARIVLGDSRKLQSVLGVSESAVGLISSPPFSPLKNQPCIGQGVRKDLKAIGKNPEASYGSTPGNLGNMIMSSPPYAGTSPEKNSNGIDKAKQFESYRKAGGGQDYEGFCRIQDKHSQGYGSTDGQLSATPAGLFGMAISSPPYEGSIDHAPGNKNWRGKMPGNLMFYGSTDGQLGQNSDGTFWSAARMIVEQVHACLCPGGHAIWVVKAFVKNKAIVDFPGQWKILCESVGFRTLHVHRAWVVENYGVQEGLFGTTKEHIKSRKSFFRKLCESKGSPRIDWEEVICMEKA